jgi:hypothetical protein
MIRALSLMEFDDDDLPDGFPNLWQRIVDRLKTFGAKVASTSTKLGVNRAVGRDPEAQRAAQARHYAKVREDAEAMHRKREAARASYLRKHPGAKPRLRGRKP